VPELVDVVGPLAQVAGLDPAGEVFPRRAVAHRGDRDHVVRPPGAMGVVQEVEETSVVTLGEQRHPTIAVGGLEVFFVCTRDLVHLVHEQQCAPRTSACVSGGA
jgi:hypothetical protein